MTSFEELEVKARKHGLLSKPEVLMLLDILTTAKENGRGPVPFNKFDELTLDKYGFSLKETSLRRYLDALQQEGAIIKITKVEDGKQVHSYSLNRAFREYKVLPLTQTNFIMTMMLLSISAILYHLLISSIGYLLYVTYGIVAYNIAIISTNYIDYHYNFGDYVNHFRKNKTQSVESRQLLESSTDTTKSSSTEVSDTHQKLAGLKDND